MGGRPKGLLAAPDGGTLVAEAPSLDDWDSPEDMARARAKGLR
jgi:hypothetical protein